MVDLITCGAINWDISLFVDRFPKLGEEVPVREIKRVSGGTAANVAVAAARILGSNKVAFIGALGDDDIGKIQIRILEDEGVITSGIKIINGVESGQAYIVIDAQGRNVIHTFFGANLRFGPEALMEEQILRLIRESKVIVIMDPPLETAEKLAEIAHKDGERIVIWDPGVYVEYGLEKLRETLRNVDYFILNHLEYEHLLGTSEPKKVGEKLSEINPNIVAIIKHGEKGSFLVKERGAELHWLAAIPLEKLGLKVVNTVGCGDAFIGAFASAKVLGFDDLEALKWANTAGAFKATKIETRGSPKKDELLDLLRKAEALGIWR